MELRAGYNQTEAGAIPANWHLAPLNGKIGIAHGFAFSSEHFAGHGPYLLTTPGHFYEAGGFRDIGDKQKYFDGPVSRDYVLQPGELIVAMTEQADGLLGSAALIPSTGSYLHNQRLGRVKALSSDIDLGYLFFVLNSPAYRAKVRETAAGTKVKHTSPGKLLEIPVRLPPIAEQKAIAAALSDVDALLGALDRLIAKKRDLKQAAMQQLLTGQTRLPGFSGKWETQSIESLEATRTVRLGRGKVISKKDIARHPGDFPIYSSSVHNDGLFGRYGDFMFDEEMITWSVDGGGHFFHRAQHRFSVTNVCGYMRADTTRLNYRFLAAQLQHLHSKLKFDYQDKAHPSVIRKAYDLALPALAEQEAISVLLFDMDVEINALEQRRDKTRLLKQGMMQELLTGRTRLV